MSIIKTHDVTLYGGNDIDIVLRPLCDDHLPLLYKWCADPEVLYWTEGGTNETDLSYGPDTVHQIYGGDKEKILYFLIEADGVPIGECWLQKMNLPGVIAMYPENLDVRRIDMSIGEKAYWNKGIGTQFIGMMIDFAFCGEYVDALHCFCEDYNVRSRRMWEKHGFVRVLQEPLEPQPQKGQWQYHYRLTRREFIERRRVRVPAEKRFMIPIAGLQPSQLYISEGKLRLVREWFDPDNAERFDPIPVKRLDGKTLMTDGHTRAVAAHLAGWDSVPAYWDEDELDMRAYAMDVKWCGEEGIRNPALLAGRIVPHKDYERLWRKRCMEMALD
ncbi:MAG: GNAT family N-acetyltransferase [Oscillospiraceae bacterium]|jgi:RimJ/RimL family protein N-acetyltransferase|nr:GNAT family N-acetyltransferase [Oscillospiraceae bacterium]